jgi:hypothetical protein
MEEIGSSEKETKTADFRDTTFLINKTLPIHRWVPWIAGFSSRFVKDASTATVADTCTGKGGGEPYLGTPEVQFDEGT